MEEAWRRILVGPEDSVERALEVLDRAGLRLVIVVDAQQRLLGVATDGDFRRAILAHVPIDRPVRSIMNEDPTVMCLGSGRGAAMEAMSSLGINALPVIDEDRTVVGVETLQSLVAQPKRPNPVFIMAGGLGERLMPLTESCPKPMLRVGDKPVLQILMEHCINLGFANFFLSTHYLPELIRDHFKDGDDLGAAIKYVHEENPLGTAGALKLLPDKIEQPLIMMNGDILTKIDFNEMLMSHNAQEADITVAVRNYSVRIPYGVVRGDDTVVSEIEEKPLQTFLISTGIYVVSPCIIDLIDVDERIDMPDLLRRVMKNDGKVSKFPVHEYWLDIGQLPDFEQAQVDYLENF